MKLHNTSTMVHLAHCHWPFLTLTYFLHLAEQYLVCVFSFVSQTQRPFCSWNFIHTSATMHPAHCHWPTELHLLLMLGWAMFTSGFSSISGTLRPLYYWNFIHTSVLTQPARCHWLILTLTHFSCLAEQCSVSAFSSISGTLRPQYINETLYTHLLGHTLPTAIRRYWPWPTFHTWLSNC